MGRSPHARDVALGLVVIAGRAGAAAGRVALLPARVIVRAPGLGSAVSRANDRLAEEGSEAVAERRRGLEAAVGDLLASEETERTLDRAMAGPLPDAAARALAEHRVVERIVGEVVSSPQFEEAVATALEHEVARRLADRVIASGLSAEVTDRVLESDELQRVVEHVASSPEVRVALARQTTSLADELVGGLRRRSAVVDDDAQRRVRKRLGRTAPEPDGLFGGLATRAVAFAIDLTVALGVFLTGAALAGLAASLVGELRPAWLVGALLGAWWTLAVGGYFVLFWAGAGQTPGMRVMRLRVVDGHGETPGTARAAVRLVGLLLAIVPLFAGFLPMLVDLRRRGLQDFLAGTFVVATERATPRRLAASLGSGAPQDAANADLAR